MKRIAFLLLVAVVVLASRAEILTQGYCKYQTNSEAMCECIGLTDEAKTMSGLTIEIPMYVSGRRVAYIANGAFEGESAIKSLTILGTTMYLIGTEAFKDCKNLQSVGIIAERIDEAAFKGCTALNDLSILEGCRVIGYKAFENCTALTRVYIPPSCYSLSPSAFNGCTSLATFTTSEGSVYYQAVNGVLYRNDLSALVRVPPAKTSFTWPNSNIKIIYSHAFANCRISDIEVPYGVTEIGENAFAFSSALEHLVIPSSVTSLTNHFVEGCTNMKTMYVNMPTPPTGWSMELIFGTGVTKYPNLYVPYGKINTYKAAGWDGFARYNNLGEQAYDIAVAPYYYTVTSEETYQSPATGNTYDGTAKLTGCFYASNIALPTSITYKGKTYALTNIGSESLNISGSYTIASAPSIVSVEENAFALGKGVTSVNLPSLVVIGYSAFNGCSALTSMTIPSTVTNIGGIAFKDCTGLEKITCGSSNPSSMTLGSNVFSGVPKSTCTLNVPRNCKSLYASADQWRDFTNIVARSYDFEAVSSSGIIYYNITSEDDKTCEVTYKDTNYNSYSGTVNIPSTVKHNGVTYTVTAVGYKAFKDCVNLSSVTMPTTVERIWSNAFTNCTKLTSMTIPSSVNRLDGGAFSECPSIMSFYGKFATADGRALITDDHTLKAYAAASGSSYAVPSDVTAIAKYTFDGLTSLSEVTLPRGIKSIDIYAFYNCTGLRRLTCKNPDPNITLGRDVFYNVTGNCTLYVPRASVSLYQAHNVWKEFYKIEGIDAGIVGDVNGDGVVDISDVNLCINVILGTASQSSYPGADVNGDGAVDIADVNAIINIILG